MTIDWDKLAAPFPATDIEWRLQSSGKRATGEIWGRCLAYVTNRAIQDRLDSVVGPENWKNEYVPWEVGTPGVLCGISIRLEFLVDNHTQAEWVTKWDGAEQTDIEHVKGGLSAAMKRAAVQWGIGRYLYDLPAGWAKVAPDGEHYGKTKDGTEFRWNTPDLPEWATPLGSKSTERAPALDSGLAPRAPVTTPVQSAFTPNQSAPVSSTPAAKPGPYAPTEKQVAFYQKLINSHVFTPGERTTALEWLANKATRQTIKDQIDHLKSTVEARKNQGSTPTPQAVTAGSEPGDASPPPPDEPPPWLT